MTYRQIVDFRKEVMDLPKIYQDNKVEEILSRVPLYATNNNYYQQVSSTDIQLSNRKYWIDKFGNENPTIPFGIYADYMLTDQLGDLEDFDLNTPTKFSYCCILPDSGWETDESSEEIGLNTSYLWYMSAAIYVSDLTYSPFLQYKSPNNSNNDKPLLTVETIVQIENTTVEKAYKLYDASTIIQLNAGETITKISYNCPPKSNIGDIYHNEKEGAIYFNPVIFYSKYKLPPSALPRIYHTNGGIITPIDCWLTLKDNIDCGYYPKPNK